MTPEEILSHPPKVLTEEQRAFYFDQGYLLLERFLPEPWIDRLRQTTDEVIADSRAISESDADAAAIDPAKVKYLDGPAGSMTIHGSKPNSAATGRPRRWPSSTRPQVCLPPPPAMCTSPTRAITGFV